MNEENPSRLLIDGREFCIVEEVFVEAPGRHRLILDKELEVDLLDSRKFEILLPQGQRIWFDVVFDDEGDERPSIVGCPRPEGFFDPKIQP